MDNSFQDQEKTDSNITEIFNGNTKPQEVQDEIRGAVFG